MSDGTIKTQTRANPEQHCSICKDQGEGLMLCASCSTTQHASCMIEFGGCSGCRATDPHGVASKQANEEIPFVPSGVSLAEVRRMDAPSYTPPPYRPPCPRHEADQLDSATRKALLFGEGDDSCNCPSKEKQAAHKARLALIAEAQDTLKMLDSPLHKALAGIKPKAPAYTPPPWTPETEAERHSGRAAAKPPRSSPLLSHKEAPELCYYCYDGRVVPEGDEFGDGTSSCPKCCPRSAIPNRVVSARTRVSLASGLFSACCASPCSPGSPRSSGDTHHELREGIRGRDARSYHSLPLLHLPDHRSTAQWCCGGYLPRRSRVGIPRGTRQRAYVLRRR